MYNSASLVSECMYCCCMYTPRVRAVHARLVPAWSSRWTRTKPERGPASLIIFITYFWCGDLWTGILSLGTFGWLSFRDVNHGRGWQALCWPGESVAQAQARCLPPTIDWLFICSGAATKNQHQLWSHLTLGMWLQPASCLWITPAPRKA